MAKKPVSAFELAVKLLGGRAKSGAQLNAALLARGHAPAVVQSALQRCAELGYLDDARTSADFAARLFGEGRSLLEVQRRLLAKGLDPAAATLLPHDELAAAQRLLKAKRVSGVKAVRLLLSRGFDEELVTRLVEVPDSGE